MLNLSATLLLTTITAAFIATIASAEKADVVPCCTADGANATPSSTPVTAAPLVCTLTSKETRDRRREVVALIQRAAHNVEELDNGYLISFQKGYGKEIVKFIEIERECCRFFEFDLKFSKNNGPITLAITGPEGSKQFSSGLVKAMSKNVSVDTGESADACCAAQK